MMKKALLLGAITVALSTTAANAAKYGFATTSGFAYCNGVDVVASGSVYTGHTIYNSYCAPYYSNVYIGGLKGTLPSLGAGKWITLNLAPGAAGNPLNFIVTEYINTQALTWYIGFMADGGGYYETFNIPESGLLTKGAPPDAVVKGKEKFVREPNFKAVLDKLKISKK